VNIDLLFLSRDLAPPRQDVWKAIEVQEGVTLRVIRITGPALSGDRSRFETIARARNAGKRLGATPFVMLLDDDVVLGPRCVARLAEGLRMRQEFAALAADTTGEMDSGWDHWDYPRHVRMTAVLFRRERLEAITFRWEPSQCDCQCCCDDLRRAGHAIGYMAKAEAWHRPLPTAVVPPGVEVSPHRTLPCRAAEATKPSPATEIPSLPGRILAAFDRKHLRLFVRRFLRTLRNEGNSETVTAVTSGLFPSERRCLARMPRVEVIVAPNDGHPARQRLRDFQPVVASWHPDTPVAYWDAADVVFQDRIAPLWDLVRTHPDRLLVVTEPIPFHESTTCWKWTELIQDPEARARALDLFRGCLTINSGFAAGTARTMLGYLKEADRLLNSPALEGTGDWGDQTAMNLYCRSNPHTWREIPTGWNYCILGRRPGEFRVSSEGRTERLDGEPLHVVHGQGMTLKYWDLIHLTA
jgi:hypothetical protein